MGLWQQCYYLLKRNAWMKWRSRGQTIQEVLWPIYFVAILAVIRLTTQPDTLNEIDSFGTRDINATFPLPQNHNVVQIGYYPSRAIHMRAMSEVRRSLSRFSGREFALVQANSTDDLASMYARKKVYVGVVFNEGALNNYTIRVPPNLIADTNKLKAEESNCRKADLNYSPYSTPTQCPAYSYITSGFTALQVALDMAIFKVGLNTSQVLDVETEMFPKTEYPPNIQYLQSIISIYLVLAFSPMVNFLMVNLVTEKEKKIKEGMKMMGLSDSAFWLSWFITYGIIMLATVLFTSIISVLAIFQHSNFLVLFLMYLGYGLSVISFSFMLTPFFSKALVAGAIGSMMTVVFSVFVLLAVYTDVSSDVQWILSVLSPAAFGFGLVKVIGSESRTDQCSVLSDK